MKLFIATVFLAVVCFIVFKVKYGSQGKKLTPRNPFRATSIVPGFGACNAVKAVAGKRFLDVDKAVPRLPLSDCDAKKCRCNYEHHHDRREDQDGRRHPRSLQSDLYDQTGNEDRRGKRRGRRKTDHT